MEYKLQKQYRLKDWDYASDGCYFITICTRNRRCLFGSIKNEEIQLSRIGKVVKEEWLKTEKIRKGIELDEYQVMPNHMHGIIIIDSNGRNTPRRVPTGIEPLINNSLSSIINHFKGAVKKWSNENGCGYFAWQSRFYDRVIRSDEELNKIREYIQYNVLKWDLDKNNPENLLI